MTWRIDDGSEEEREGYRLGSGVRPDLVAARGCKQCKGTGYLVCSEGHLVVHKQVNVLTGETRQVGESRETCFGHLCTTCQPKALLVEEKLRQ